MYKLEDLRFLNMKKFNMGKFKMYEIENQLSVDEKIKFIDEVENGFATYMLNILIKWESEKDTLPKGSYKSPKTVSKKAWIKRNDERKIIDTDYKIGSYYFLGTDFKRMDLICPDTEYGYEYAYTGDDIVNQWFHDLCIKLHNNEDKYFKSINPFDIKLKQVKEYGERHHILFDSKKVNDIVWNRDTNIEESKLDMLIEAYKKIEKFIEDITVEVKEQIGE